MDTHLITAVGADPEGQTVLRRTAEAGVHVDRALILDDQKTSAYLAVLDESGSLRLALDDMRPVDSVTPAYLRTCKSLIDGAAAVFVDGNLSPKALAAVISMAVRAGVPVAADPTSVSLASRFTPHLKDLWLLTPNEAEAGVLCPHAVPHADRNLAIDAARHLVSQGVQIAAISMAESGVGYASGESSGFVPAVQTEVIDPTGAGDALTAAIIFALLNEIPLDESVRLGAAAAALTLRTPGSVASNLSLELLYDQLG
jgi:pseudouridine kinase